MLRLTDALRDAMIATCIRALPDEGCGLMLGTDDDTVTEIVPSSNVAHSAKVYEVDSRVLLETYRRADDESLRVLGVFHSHTHSEAYPSPTDVLQAPDPAWHYVLVSFRARPTIVRSYRIVDAAVNEEEISL